MNLPKLPHSKTKWSDTEIQQFFAYYELYKNDFHSYERHLNRTHSQIKAFFHNWLRRQDPETRKQYVVDQRGGVHQAYRNQVQLAASDGLFDLQAAEIPKSESCTANSMSSLFPDLETPANASGEFQAKSRQRARSNYPLSVISGVTSAVSSLQNSISEIEASTARCPPDACVKLSLSCLFNLPNCSQELFK
ncbi:SANT/Myb_domain [Hexamita inflata]|uniref:SANT/Myb domain n=1 Tax=Hexamita inflata TaxID=28002 RepID=A0AA86NJW1_9EUKA|nr:SANT/Myb domain [Hexamita inflata]